MKRSEPRIFHYTIAELYNLIQQDQLIRPATEHVPPPAHYVYDLASSIWARTPGSKRISFWTPQNVGLSGRLASKASYGSAAARASAGISTSLRIRLRHQSGLAAATLGSPLTPYCMPESSRSFALRSAEGPALSTPGRRTRRA
jgi:hypothetical protein